MVLKKKKKIKRKSPFTKSRAYLMTLCSFFVVIFIVIVGAKTEDSDVKLIEMEEGVPTYFGSGMEITEQRKEYNPTNNILRVDYEFSSESLDVDFKNLDFEFTNHYLSDKTIDLKPKVYKVSDTYMVTITENVPVDYQAISTTITPSYIHDELATDKNALDESTMKFYLKEENVNENLLLEEETSEEYKEEYIDFEVEEINKNIDDLNQDIEEKNNANYQLKLQNVEYEDQVKYQYGDDAVETNQIIDKNLTQITTNESEIAEMQEEIKEDEKKIELLEQSRSEN